MPEGLTAADWSGIQAAYEAGRHAAQPVECGYQACNPGQQWRTRFDGRGFTTRPDEGDWSWGLQLERYGVGGMQAASVLDPIFWAGIAAAVPAGFLAAWPVNWWLIKRDLKKCH